MTFPKVLSAFTPHPSIKIEDFLSAGLAILVVLTVCLARFEHEKRLRKLESTQQMAPAVWYSVASDNRVPYQLEYKLNRYGGYMNVLKLDRSKSKIYLTKLSNSGVSNQVKQRRVLRRVMSPTTVRSAEMVLNANRLKMQSVELTQTSSSPDALVSRPSDS